MFFPIYSPKYSPPPAAVQYSHQFLLSALSRSCVKSTQDWDTPWVKPLRANPNLQVRGLIVACVPVCFSITKSLCFAQSLQGQQRCSDGHVPTDTKPGQVSSAVPRALQWCQSWIVKGFICLPSGCADKSPAITGNKAIMAICSNILANFPCYEIYFLFLRLKGIDYKDISHFSLLKYIIFSICLPHFRIDLVYDELAFLQGYSCALCAGLDHYWERGSHCKFGRDIASL